jgi:hypothetical protein
MSELRFPMYGPHSPVSGRHHRQHQSHPLRHHAPRIKTIYDNMPSSPLAPPISPDDGAIREYVEYGKTKRTRTLEWACARRRLATKEGELSGGDETEVDEDNDMLKETLVGEKDDSRQMELPVIAGGLLQPKRVKQTEAQKMDNEDMLAAVALCRLGQGR